MKEDSIKLFVDAHVFDGKFQGTRTFIGEIYAILAQKPGIELYLGAEDTDNLKKYFPVQGNVHFIKYKSASGFIRLLYDIPAIIRKNGIEYAHFQYMAPPVKNCRFIVTVHDVIFNEYPEEFSFSYRVRKRWLYRVSAMRADILTTVSEYSKKSMQKYLGIETAHTVITPNGVSPKFFAPYNKEQSKAYIRAKYGVDNCILFVSRLEPRKNHLLLLKAYLELKLYAKGYHLVFLGHKTMDVSGFEQTIHDLPESTRRFIFLHDAIDDTDLLEFYRASSVFVYPSKAEGFGIPPLEAGALRIPVICSNTSAMSEFSFFGKTHVDPGDYDLFVQTLDEVINHPPSETHLKNISEVIAQKYAWSQSAEKIYQAIINDKNITFEKEIQKN